MKSVGLMLRWLVEAMESERGWDRDIKLKSHISSATGIHVSRANPAHPVEVRARMCMHGFSVCVRVCAKARAVITGGVWKAAACYRRSLAKPRKWMLFLLFPNTNPLIFRNEPRKSVFMMLLSDCWVWAPLARRMSQGETNMYIGVHKSSFTHSSRFSFTYTYADLTLQIRFIVQEHVFWMCENTFYPGFQGVFPRKTPSGENWPPALCKHREVA